MSTAHSPASPAHPRVSAAAIVLSVLAIALAAIALGWIITSGESEAVTVHGSGVAVEATRQVEPFSAVDLSGVNRVTIGVGGEQLVVVRGDDNLVEMITTEVHGGTLVIDETGSIDSSTPMSVAITVPSLDQVRLSGSGAITIDGHDLDDLAVALPGTGTVVGAGSATTIDVDLAGSGQVDFARLVARDATIALSGSGAVLLQVTGALEADVSGAGSVTYTGEPDSVHREISGTGSIAEG